MVRLWCRAFAADVDFTTDYQPWVVAAHFSGILCVDEVYQGELALLLAVDPAAPDGDRLVGYTLLANTKARRSGSGQGVSRNVAGSQHATGPGDHRRFASVSVCAGRDLANGRASAVLVPRDSPRR